MVSTTHTITEELPFEVDKTYQTKWQTNTQFTIKEIVYHKGEPKWFKGIHSDKPELGICPLNVDRLIPHTKKTIEDRNPYEIILDVLSEDKNNFVSLQPDLSDIGNSIGVAIQSMIEHNDKNTIDDFMSGLKHGISLIDGTHG